MRRKIILLILLIPLSGYGQELEPPYIYDGHQKNFVVIAPLGTLGPTWLHGGLVNGVSSTSSLSFTAGVEGLFHLFSGNTQEDDINSRFSPALQLDYHSAAREFSSMGGIGNLIRVNYFEVEPGVIWNGIFTLGLKIGIPLNATSTVSSTPTSEIITTLSPGETKLLVAPELRMAIPLLWYLQHDQGLFLFLSFDYALNRVFEKSPALFDAGGAQVGTSGSFNYYSFQVGLTYAFEIITHGR